MDKIQGNYPYFEEVNPGIIQEVVSGLKILDVGCGYGCLGEAMTKKGNIVFGIDIAPEAVEKARKRIHFACEADATKPGSLPVELREEKFDVVVLSDIIEHVYDPMALLINVKTFLKEDGELLLSVPNVASWATRLNLLFGRWEYTISGVLDRGHIRFFTLNSIKRLLKTAQFEIIDISVTPHFIRAFAGPLRNWLFPDSMDGAPSDPTALMKSKYYKFYFAYIYRAEALIASFWKRMFAFQFIIRAKAC